MHISVMAYFLLLFSWGLLAYNLKKSIKRQTELMELNSKLFEQNQEMYRLLDKINTEVNQDENTEI